MTDPAQLKLSRADAVALVAKQIAEDAADEVSKCERELIRARDRFRSYVGNLALSHYCETLERLADAVQLANVGDLHQHVPYNVYVDGTHSGDVAEVVFADHAQTYEARVRVALRVQLDDDAIEYRTDWLAAMVDLRNARERDLRVGAMKKEARDELIKAALDSPEGAALLVAVKALSATMKGKA